MYHATWDIEDVLLTDDAEDRAVIALEKRCTSRHCEEGKDEAIQEVTNLLDIWISSRHAARG